MRIVPPFAHSLAARVPLPSINGDMPTTVSTPTLSLVNRCQLGCPVQIPIQGTHVFPISPFQRNMHAMIDVTNVLVFSMLHHPELDCVILMLRYFNCPPGCATKIMPRLGSQGDFIPEHEVLGLILHFVMGNGPLRIGGDTCCVIHFGSGLVPTLAIRPPVDIRLLFAITPRL